MPRSPASISASTPGQLPRRLGACRGLVQAGGPGRWLAAAVAPRHAATATAARVAARRDVGIIALWPRSARERRRHTRRRRGHCRTVAALLPLWPSALATHMAPAAAATRQQMRRTAQPLPRSCQRDLQTKQQCRPTWPRPVSGANRRYRAGDRAGGQGEDGFEFHIRDRPHPPSCSTRTPTPRPQRQQQPPLKATSAPTSTPCMTPTPTVTPGP